MSPWIDAVVRYRCTYGWRTGVVVGIEDNNKLIVLPDAATEEIEVDIAQVSDVQCCLISNFIK